MDGIRRGIVQAIGLYLACDPVRISFAQVSDPRHRRDNFNYVYGNAATRIEFKGFLENVFSLFPAEELHELIATGSDSYAYDADVYRFLQSRLDDVKPMFGGLSDALATLRRQKDVLTRQTAQLVDTDRTYEGYLEIGSNGRYLDSLEEAFEIAGDRFVVSERAPTNSLTDIIDRGQLAKPGDYIPLENYRTDFSAHIPRSSIDFANVFIGFHHCPLPLRESFLAGIRDVLSPSAKLVVRDHNVHDEKMWKIVALAHDVFNMGTEESWEYNERELRHFYPLDSLDAMLRDAGFRSDGRRVYQSGDPTLNALMVYTKR